MAISIPVVHLWAKGLIVAVVVSGIWWHGHHAGAAAVKQQWQAEDQQRAIQAAEAAIESARISAAQSRRNEEVSHDTIRLRNALSRRLAGDGLRIEPPAPGGGLPATADGAGRTDAAAAGPQPSAAGPQACADDGLRERAAQDALTVLLWQRWACEQGMCVR